MQNYKPLVAIVGRPNVGKSTLFNRLVGSRRAITNATAGTTRDRLYADGEWQGQAVTYVDTGGLADPTEEQVIQQAVNQQVDEAISEADLLLFMVDSQSGPLAEDTAVAERIRKSGKPVVVVANKADNQDLAKQASEFWEFGLGDPVPVSAQHGRGTGDILDLIIRQSKQSKRLSEPEQTMPRVAFVGRANVGKSTLFNQLAHQDRMITSSQPHTTRDVGTMTVDSSAGPLHLLDTAGIQRRGKSGKGIPKYSLLRTIRAINEADVVCLMIDGVEGPTVQDAHITSYILEAGKAIVLAVNKWDLVEKAPDIQEQFYAQLEDKLGFLPSPPVVFISAKTGEKIERLARAVYDVWKIAGTKVSTRELNKLVTDNLDRLPAGKRHRPKLYYATQVDVYPPTFMVFVNKSEAWENNHRRWLSNLIRDHFKLLGTAITLRFRAKKPDLKVGK